MVHRRVLTKAGKYLVKYSMSKLMKKSKAQITSGMIKGQNYTCNRDFKTRKSAIWTTLYQ